MSECGFHGRWGRAAILVLALIALVMAPRRAGAQRLPQEAARSYSQLGVTVTAPGADWTVIRAERRETGFEKQRPTERELAGSRALEPTTFGTGSEVWPRMETWKEGQLLSGVLKRDSIHFNRLRFKGLSCLQYDGIFKVNTAAQPFSYFNVKGYLCPVGGKEPWIVELEVSSRSNQRGFSEAFITVAERFFDAAVFAPVK
jgi:hypothetical protein